jgi:hypothetical protein
MNMKKSSLFAVLLSVSCATALAQDEMPAVSQQPAATAADNGDASGTTIFGERESPIGLYITPWRDAHAERDIDRPARLLQEKPLPLDRIVFARQVEYYEALTAELVKKGIVTPERH